MKRVHIVGRKNHGKTRLVGQLVQHLTRQGWRVGTIKHTPHQHELDTPGKDSWVHRQAGATVVGVLSGTLSAVFVPVAGPTDSEDRYRELADLYTGCDLVLVEGNLASPAPKVEVWRAELGTDPIYPSDPGIEVVVADAELPVPHPRPLPSTAIAAVADWILGRWQLTRP